MGLPLAVRIGTPSAPTISPFSFRRSMGRVNQLSLVGLTMDEKKCIVQMGVVVIVSSLTKSQWDNPRQSHEGVTDGN